MECYERVGRNHELLHIKRERCELIEIGVHGWLESIVLGRILNRLIILAIKTVD